MELKLYENIKAFRLALGWSQQELAEKVGYNDRSSIAKIESGKIDLSRSKIAEFAKVFNITPAKLMGWDDDTILRKAAMEKVNSDSFLEKTVNEQRFLLSIPDKEAQIITSYRIASPDDRALVDLVLRKYCENPAQGGESVG